MENTSEPSNEVSRVLAIIHEVFAMSFRCQRRMNLGLKLSARNVLRIILGVAFMVSGAAKMFDIYGFAKVVASYAILPEGLVVSVSIVIPFAEFILGAMLLMDYHERVASFSLLVMVIVFTGLSALKYFSGAAGDCGCFGKLVERKIGLLFFIENAAIIVALLLTTFGRVKYGKRIEC